MSDATVPRRLGDHRAARALAALLLAAGLALPAVVLLPVPPADADTTCDGVTVRVERPGSTRDRCAPGAPRNGLYALTEAGFTYTNVPGQEGFVCTIDRYPDPCNGAPADAYWAYYHADAGATTWTYSNRGAGNRTPAKGSHEAWVFGAGARPSAPPPTTAPEPSPTPSPTSSPTPSPSPPKGGSGGSSGGSGGSAGSGTGSSDTGSTGSTGSSGGSSGPSRGGGSGGASTDGTGGPRAGTSSTDGSERADPRSATDKSDDDETGPPRGTDDGDGSTAGSDVERSEDVGAEADGERSEDADDSDEREGQDDTVRPEALDDTVTIEAPGGGRAGSGAAAAGALLIVGLGTAGLLRARGRRGDPGTEA